MSMNDPIADMLTRIRNAQAVYKREVVMDSSKAKAAIAETLKQEGYISDFVVTTEGAKSALKLVLKYFDGQPVISRIERVSKPGIKIYRKKDELPKIDNGLGIAIVSTSKGLMSDHKARQLGIGGKIICYVS